MDNEMTPLNRIMPQQSMNSGMDDGDALVNEILSDVNDLGRMPPPPQQQQQQQQGMRRPVPMRQVQPRQEEIEMLEDEEYEEEYQSPPPRQMAVRRRVNLDNSSQSQSQSQSVPREKEEDDFFKLILDNAKLPLIVGLLVLLMGMTYADDTLGKFIPSLMTANGNLGFGGLVAKAVTAGLLFYVLQRLLS
jgi:hypothetical protein